MAEFNETQAEFESRVVAAMRENNERVREFGVDVVSLPCSCEDGGGPWHWAMVRNDQEQIAEHVEHEEILASLRDDSTVVD